MPSIKTYNKISKDGLKLLDQVGWVYGDSVADPDGIVLRSASLHGVALPSSLKAIARAGAGTNNIPVDECTRRGIVVFNAPGANANAVKELVIAGMLMASRHLVGAVSHCASLQGRGVDVPALVEKDKARFLGHEIRSKRLGVVGLGAIGMMVANDAVSLGLEVSGYDPFISVRSAWSLSRAVKPAQSLAKLFAESDFVSLHMPLTPDTVELINQKSLHQFKKGAVLLNFARSEIVNDHDVLEALNANHLGGYITDFPTDELLQHPKVVCLPHLGASTVEAENNCAIMVVQQLIDFIANGNIVNSVNYPHCAIDRSGDYRLIITNDNVPNMVGQISSVIASEGLNIIEMVNKSRGDLAYNIVDLAGKPSHSLVDRIVSISGVTMARVL
ncbi:3-phosphoglycerate dehydrogenase [bacterium]|nr:3-phosphoglycerate dehydrogenase [bacterium]